MSKRTVAFKYLLGKEEEKKGTVPCRVSYEDEEECHPAEALEAEQDEASPPLLAEIHELLGQILEEEGDLPILEDDALSLHYGGWLVELTVRPLETVPK